jgi:hypothetical protein
MTFRVTNNIYQKQIKYHVFNAVTNSELTEPVPVFTIRPAFPTSVKKVNTSFKNVFLHASFYHAESVCFKSVIQSGRSLFLSKIKIPEFLKFVGPIGPGGQKIIFYLINFLGAFHSKRSSYASQYIQLYLFS